MSHPESASDLPLAYQTYLRNDQDEQSHWEDVCNAFRQYAVFAECQRTNQRYRLDALPESQKHVLPQALLKDTPEATKRASQYKEACIRNQFCLDCILRHAGMPHSQQVAQPASAASDDHFSKVSSVLKSLARDWSAEGKEERDMAYEPILRRIRHVLPPVDHLGLPPKLCVPGAGVGRLALELSALGYSVQGNEFSLFMLLASDFVLNGAVCTTDHPLEISPWLLESRNVHGCSDPFRAVKIPDINPPSIMERGPNQTSRKFSMAAGEFCSVYRADKEHGQWDGIVSCFFLDAAPSIVEYLQVVFDMLKDGGVLLNFGPLLYHWSGPTMRPDDRSFQDYQHRFQHLDKRYLQSVDLCWEDIREIIINIGFEIEEEKVGIDALYTADRKSMMRLSYRCIQFLARKPRSG